MMRRGSGSGRVVTISFFLALILSAAFSAAARAELRVEKDIVYATVGNIELKGDMYIPDGPGPFPGLLEIHGGGFFAGDKNWGPLIPFTKFFAEKGFAVFSVNYRLLKEGGMFPNNVKDVKCALAWMKANAPKYNIDATRIGALGESAGGYLAAMIAFTQNMKEFQPDCEEFRDADTSVVAAALYYTPSDFTTFKGGISRLLKIELQTEGHLKSIKDINKFMVDNSPITYVKNAPPLYITFSDPDNTVPQQQDYEMMDALKKEGKYFEFYIATGEGMDHGFAIDKFDSPQAAAANGGAAAFLDKFVKNKK
jgi:acetyl esterase/lipase